MTEQSLILLVIIIQIVEGESLVNFLVLVVGSRCTTRLSERLAVFERNLFVSFDDLDHLLLYNPKKQHHIAL